MRDLKKNYKNETKKSPFVFNENGEITSNFSYTDDYVLWLENKINIDCKKNIISAFEKGNYTKEKHLKYLLSKGIKL